MHPQARADLERRFDGAIPAHLLRTAEDDRRERAGTLALLNRMCRDYAGTYLQAAQRRNVADTDADRAYWQGWCDRAFRNMESTAKMRDAMMGAAS